MTLGFLAARFKKFFLVTLVSISAVNMPLVYAGTVTVHVKDGSGTAIANAVVYAICNTDHGPDGTESQVATANGSGDATLTLSDSKSFEIIADKDGVGPTARTQYFSPTHLHLNSGVTSSQQVTLDQTFTGRGTITVSATNATIGKTVFGSIRKKSTGSDVAFSAGTADGGGNTTLVFTNIPIAAADIYEASIFDPSGLNGQGVGNAASVGAVNASANTNVPLDISAGLPPDLSSNQDTGNNNGPTTGATVRGVVEDSTDHTKVIPYGSIQLMTYDGSSHSVHFVAGAPIDQNGRYEIRGLAADTYYVQTFGGCIQGGSCYTGYQNTTLQSGTTPTPTANDITIISADADAQAVVVVHTKLDASPKGQGILRVIVKDTDGNLIPGANVNISGDGSQWNTTGAPVCDGTSDTPQSHPAFYQQNKQAATGVARFTEIPDGNLMINVWTPFSQTASIYNAGDNKIWSMAPGIHGCVTDVEGSLDDYRVNMSCPTVHVYDIAGAEPAGKVTTDGGEQAITVTIPRTGTGDGTIHISATFPEDVTLTEPISIIFSSCDNTGCVGNFGTLSGATTNKTLTTTVLVDKSKTYYMDVRSKYWGLVREGGGNDQIAFVGQTEMTRNFKFAPAGRIVGKLFKPDGSLFIPQNGQNYVSANVNAQGDNNWGNTQLNDDGSFTIGGLIPGKYKLVPQQQGSGDATYAAKNNLDEVIVTANTDVEKNVSFVNGVLVAPSANLGTLPNLHMQFDGNGRLTTEGYDIIRVKSGVPMTPDQLRTILVNSDDSTRFRFTPAGSSNCNTVSAVADEFCPEFVGINDAYDFLLLRRGDIDAGVHQYITFYDTKENVAVTRDAVADPKVSYQSHMIQPLHVDFTTNITDDGTKISGTIVAENLLRAVDFAKFGGDFSNFIKYIPTIVVKNALTGKIIGVGLVTPPPAAIAGSVGDQINADVAHNDYAAFKQLIDGLAWSFEIRGIPSDTDVVLCGTTPNYPPAYKRIHTGSSGSTATWDFNWDSIGAGGTITGTVKDSNGDPIESASVELKAPGFSSKVVTTDSNGVYIQPGLPQGPYKITVSASGKAPLAKRDVLSGSKTDTVDFTLVDGPGSLTGTVTRISATSSGIVNKPVENANIVAYDDTQNLANPTEPLALLRTASAGDGTYTIAGLIPGHSIVVTCRTDGNYPARTTATATGGVVTGVDFKLQPKPLDVDLVVSFDKVTSEFVFRVKNPKNFDSGRVWYYNAANTFDSADTVNDPEITSSFVNLPDGSLVARLASSLLTAGVTYKLYIDAIPADGSPDVIKQMTFSLDIKNNSVSSIDNAILGDDTETNGVASNTIQGADGSSIDFEAGSVLPGTGSDTPFTQITQQPADDGSHGITVLGNPTGVTMNNVDFTDRPDPFSIPFDSQNVDPSVINNLALYILDPNTGQWTEETDHTSVDPVSGTISGFATFGNIASSEIQLQSSSVGNKPGGMKTMKVPGQMKALKNGKGYSANPHAMATGTVIFAVGVAQASGVSAIGYHQYNFPNPFNLKDKTVTLRGGSTGVATTIRGTYIVVAPTGSGPTDIKIKIYNVAGDMVREFKSAGTAGQYNYIEWDGRNTSGSDVASGVYFAVVDAPGAPNKKPIKMVVVK